MGEHSKFTSVLVHTLSASKSSQQSEQCDGIVCERHLQVSGASHLELVLGGSNSGSANLAGDGLLDGGLNGVSPPGDLEESFDVFDLLGLKKMGKINKSARLALGHDRNGLSGLI